MNRWCVRVAYAWVVLTSGTSVWAQETGLVALEWRGVLTEVSVGDTIEVALYAVSEDGTEQSVQALDAIVQWDPLVLAFVEKLDDDPVTWAVSTFPNDQGLDRLNADCGPDVFCEPFTEFPYSDGEMFLQNFELPPFQVADLDGLFVGTLVFRALTDAVLTEVSLAPTAGKFSFTKVVSGDPLDPGRIITGALGSIAISVCPKGDFNASCAADLGDVSDFDLCLVGPHGPFSVTVACREADADGDGDVDLRDFAAFQSAFSGP